MRAADLTDAEVRAGGLLQVEVTAWLGDELLVELPVVSGSWKVTDTADVDVPGSIEFAVPATAEWLPLTPGHPLAAFGQRYRIRVGFGEELLPWGWFRANPAQLSGSVLNCSGQGLLRDVQRARFTRPFQTTAGQTWQSVLQALLRGILPLSVEDVPDSALAVTTWEEDRLAAVWEVIESRPARLIVDDTATAVVLPAWNDSSPGAPVAELVDGQNGTLVSLDPDTGSDEDAPNGYVVSTVPDGDAEPIVEIWTMPDGPMKWGGPYGFNPSFFASPLNPTDRTQLRAIAERMTRRAAATQQRLGFSALPDPRWEIGDIVQVRSTKRGVNGLGRVVNLAMSRGAMTGNVAML